MVRKSLLTGVSILSCWWAALALVDRVSPFASVSSGNACSSGGETCDSQTPAWGLSRWRPEFLRVAALGQLPAIVDAVWIEAISDESLSRLGSSVRPRLFHVFDLLTDLDPAFFEAYVAAGSLLAIIRDDPRGARAILEKGEKFRTEELPSSDPALASGAWKEQWRIPFQLGYLALFEEYDLPAAERHFRVVGELPGAPLQFRRLGERFRKPEGKFEVGLNILNLQLRQEGLPEKARQELEEQRQSLLVRLEAARQDSVFQQWRLKRGLSPGDASFRRYLREWPGARAADSFGGAFFVDGNGRIDSRTPRVPVFGLN